MKIVRTSTGPALVNPKTYEVILPSDTEALGEIAVETPAVINDLVADICDSLVESVGYFRSSWALGKDGIPADAEPTESAHVVDTIRQASQALGNLNVLVSRMLRPREAQSPDPVIAFPPGFSVAITGINGADQFVSHYYSELEFVADAQLDAVRAGDAQIYVQGVDGSPVLYEGPLPRS